MPFTVQDLIEGHPAPVTARPNEPGLAALQRMFEHDFSQLPVVDTDNRPQGMITGESILRAMSIFELPLDKLRVLDATVKAQNFRNDANLFELLDALRDTYTVLIIDGDHRLIGIVTSYDTTEYFRRRAEDMMLVEDVETTLKDYVQAAFAGAEQIKLDGLIHHTTDSDKTLHENFRKALMHYMNLDSTLSGKVTIQDSLCDQVFAQHLASKQKAKGFDDLTLHQYIDLFLHDDTWAYCGTIFELDRKAIRHLLHEIRQIRNDLAHFRAEILATQREKLHFCAEWLARHQAIAANVLASPQADVSAISNQLSTSDQMSPDLILIEEEPDPQGSRYAPLATWLQSQPTNQDRVQLSFQKIEEIIGVPLPPSARQHRSWWANDSSGHIQAQQWLDVGWRVAPVNMNEEKVTFARIKEREKAYIDFFSDFQRKLGKTDFPLKELSPDGASWLPIAALPQGGPQRSYILVSFTRDKRFRVEFYIDVFDQEKNKLVFDQLFTEKDKFEEMLDETY